MQDYIGTGKGFRCGEDDPMSLILSGKDFDYIAFLAPMCKFLSYTKKTDW